MLPYITVSLFIEFEVKFVTKQSADGSWELQKKKGSRNFEILILMPIRTKLTSDSIHLFLVFLLKGKRASIKGGLNPNLNWHQMNNMNNNNSRIKVTFMHSPYH